ncbi:MAG: hypothetical protein IPK26_11270 [Planctomycetes bacterium]|nr:hypothetical protein [Planctomycetota bacterium]
MRRVSGTAALLALVALAWPRTPPAPTPTTVAGGAVLAAAPSVVTAPALAARVAPSTGHQLLLPDGSAVPALNGAIDPAPLERYWGAFPWSPIVGRERSSAGIEWYRHADGSYSTTEMVFVEQLGKQIALTRVAHPGPEQPPNTPPDRR